MSQFKHTHTLYYDDKGDLIRQVDALLQKLVERELEPYEQVRKRYGFENSAPAFCMRIKRFLRAGGQFPHETGAKGKRIQRMAVTPALHAALTK